MTRQRLSARLRARLHQSLLTQIVLLLGVWALSDGMVRLLAIPLPAGIVGMAAVLALLASGAVSPLSMRRGANWFLAEMLLFFVPAVLAILDHGEFFGVLGLKILAVILTGTVCVMAVTAITVDLCYRWRSRHGLE